MITSQILNFAEKPIVDESIQEYEYHEHQPLAGANLNIAGEININIELQDLFSHPSESYLDFEGHHHLHVACPPDVAVPMSLLHASRFCARR